MLHGSDGEVETVVDDQAVRLGRRRERRSISREGTRLHASKTLNDSPAPSVGRLRVTSASGSRFVVCPTCRRQRSLEEASAG